MNNCLKLGLLSLAFITITGCSMGQLTTRASMPLIDGGVEALYQETDLQLAKDAIPANISLIEGMLINDPDNEELRLYAAQAYYVYRDQRLWQEWHRKIVRDLENRQSMISGHFEGGQYGRVYATAMSCLVLQIPFQYLPIFQK